MKCEHSDEKFINEKFTSLVKSFETEECNKNGKKTFC